MKKYLAALAYLATIPAANWMIQHWGPVCVPDGPCLIPVWFGVLAPSGVLCVGVALVLRDVVQESAGARWGRWVLGCIVAGTALSALLAPPRLVIASAAAFGLSELCDFVIYTPLRKRGFVTASLTSGTLDLVADSLLFLGLAFGSLEHLTGQIVGKTWAVLAGTAVLAVIRCWRES